MLKLRFFQVLSSIYLNICQFKNISILLYYLSKVRFGSYNP